jgi:hypothetical protein
MIEIKLTANVNVDGRRCKVGDVVRVDAAVADGLVALGKAERMTEAATVAPSETATNPKAKPRRKTRAKK